MKPNRKVQGTVVLTSAPSKKEALYLAGELVGRNLAACVSVAPRVHSVYRWQGKIENATEWLLLIKTTRGRFASVRKAIEELHSYDCPECIALPVTGGSVQYLAWLAGAVEEEAGAKSTRAKP